MVSDPRRLRQILLNLLSNAIKFGRGKPIEVICSITDAGGAAIEVVDHGDGISDEDQERIFHEFVQLGKTQLKDGTGLGLPISRRLAELLHGSLTVQSTVGEGSTFDSRCRRTSIHPRRSSATRMRRDGASTIVATRSSTTPRPRRARATPPIGERPNAPTSRASRIGGRWETPPASSRARDPGHTPAPCHHATHQARKCAVYSPNARVVCGPSSDPERSPLSILRCARSRHGSVRWTARNDRCGACRQRRRRHLRL